MITCEMDVLVSVSALLVVVNSEEDEKRLYTQIEFLLCLDVLHGDQCELHHCTLCQLGHFQLNHCVMD